MGSVDQSRQCMRCGKPEREVGPLQEFTLATVGGFWRTCAKCREALIRWRPKVKKGWTA